MADLIPTEVDEDDAGAGDAGEPGAPGRGEAPGDVAAGSAPAGASSQAAVPGAGAAIGRFTVLGLLGIGGMGVVLSAYDPDLDRKVALKLLRGDQFRGARAAAGRDALLREAKAMARLSHPNVVAVYEAGVLDGNGYVVMEQVAGITLRRWLDEPRGWQDVLEVLRAAGQGLAAAHRAGVIHRDFKPENVLVSDGAPARTEGRGGARDGARAEGLIVRVSDFGLAGDGTSARGTREYQAPELERGGPGEAKLGDARADQYAFCVTLWEALHGARPARGPGGAIAMPAARKAPGWIYAALLRGLAADPAARWPSMDALLVQLGRLSRARWSRLAPLLGLGAALVAAAAFLVGQERAAPPGCQRAEARLVGAWDGARRDEVARAFGDPALRFGAAAWPAVAAQLDGYARDWSAMYGAACRATHEEGRQSSRLLDLRMECLERRRGVLANLSSLWAKGMSPELVLSALDSALGLPPLAPCADVAALTGRVALPPEQAARDAIAAARAQIDHAAALLLAGQRPEAKQAAVSAQAAADATAWPAVRAEAALTLGKTLAELEEPAAEPSLLAAARFAGSARDDRLAAEAMVELVQHLAEDQQRAERALLVSEVADGLVARAGDEPIARVQWARFTAAALRVKSEYARAREVLAEARRRAVAELGEEAWDVSVLDGELARVAEAQGDTATARRLGAQVLAAAITRFGPDHPRVAAYLNNQAMAADSDGDGRAAREYHRRALAIKEKVFGDESTSTALTLNNLAIVEISLGDVAAGQAMLERALAIREKLLGPKHPHLATTLGNLSMVYLRRGRLDDGVAAAERALAIKLEAYGPDNAFVANSESDLGRLRAVQGDHAAALELFRKSLTVREKLFGAEHAKTRAARLKVASQLVELGRCGEAQPSLTAILAAAAKEADFLDEADALATLADCDLAGGQARRALPRLEKAVALLEQPPPREGGKGGSKSSDPVDPLVLGSTRWRLARALAAVGRGEEAVAAMRAAERELANDEADLEGAPILKAARAWLAQHPAAP